ncbi:hypothetical protein [Chitinophaga sp. RAB17]|uniref:hypothetical protein n=1 Tax=Chitinophaga sp. RAB17 TaxID=3233049 RepID=UPI003F90EF3B
MKKLFDPLFITYCLVWIVIHMCRYLQQPVPLLNGYLTDFIAVPAMAHITLTFTCRFIVRNNGYTYPLYYLLFIAAYTSVMFEWIMPQFSSRYTSDWWDVVTYFAGSLFYYRFHGKRLTKSVQGT